MHIIYNILLIAVGLIASPYLLVKIASDPRYKSGLLDRMGYISVKQKTKRRVMVHASSVGEVNVAYPFIKKLLECYNDIEVVLTVMTPEGYHSAKEKLAGLADVYYFCVDCRFPVKRFLDRLLPDVVFIIETEIWPTFLRALKKRGIKVVVINGRISEKSFKSYQRIKRFIRSVLGDVDLFLVQHEAYKERLAKLSGRADNIKITGNIKFDIDDTYFKINENLLKKISGIEYIVAASTHDDEERQSLLAFSKIRSRFPNLKLVIAPRHIKRCAEIESLIRQNGLIYILRSDIANDTDLKKYDVILVDTIGDLVTFFKSAKLVFMGGSLVNIGGHNIIEPAYFSRAIVFGQYMQNFTDAKELIMKEGGAVEVKSAHELSETLEALLGDESEMKRLGENAKRALDKNKGVLENTFTELKKHIVNL